MAEVNDVFSKITDEKSYFDPSKSKKTDLKEWTPIREGEYLGHITDVESKILDVKKDGNFKARMYKYTVTVAPENKEQTYRTLDINGEMNEYTGECYQNLRFKGTLWRFLEPNDGDDFDSNSGGNKGYLRFCETIGVDCPTHKKVVDGQEIEVKALPNLTTSDMLGKPVTAFVAKGRPFKNKDGVTKTYFDCKFIKTWKEGKEKVISAGGGASNDEIPF
tara:strand:+ start:2411 stop:3067 length:657 start_codon:yes stop_codon:yes gene_type:complete